MRQALILGAFALLGSGCSQTYIPPGGRADLEIFTSPDIQAGFDAKPTNPFPTSIAVVRVQDSSYTNYNIQRHGGCYRSGSCSVVLVKELDEETQFERIGQLDQVSGVATINRLLLPRQLSNERDLRVAASRLQADMVFMYTLETLFFDTDFAKPLSVVTLGLSPTRKIMVVTTSSALLMDTRTGYIYSAYESTEKAETLSTSWSNCETADEARRKTERDAFRKLVDEFVETWPQVLERYNQGTEQAGRVDF